MFNTVVSLVSLVLGFAGVVLTFVTFFAPELVLGLALRDKSGWRELPIIREDRKLYRHKTLSGYTIEVDLSEPVIEDFYEPWMEALHRPDRNAASYFVTVYFNGQPVERELFLSYDGGRNFIPVPKLSVRNGKRYVSFTKQQMQLADIVGYDHFGRDFKTVSDSILRSRR